MSKIDYSGLFHPKRASTSGHSVENSFYLQKSPEAVGRYKAYHKYVIVGTKKTVTETKGLHRK